jgi:hypothetical protein
LATLATWRFVSSPASALVSFLISERVNAGKFGFRRTRFVTTEGVKPKPEIAARRRGFSQTDFDAEGCAAECCTL